MTSYLIAIQGLLKAQSLNCDLGAKYSSGKFDTFAALSVEVLLAGKSLASEGKLSIGGSVPREYEMLISSKLTSAKELYKFSYVPKQNPALSPVEFTVYKEKANGYFLSKISPSTDFVSAARCKLQ